MKIQHGFIHQNSTGHERSRKLKSKESTDGLQYFLSLLSRSKKLMEVYFSDIDTPIGAYTVSVGIKNGISVKNRFG